MTPCWPHGRPFRPLAPVHPGGLSGQRARNAALNRYRAQKNAQKRGGSVVAVQLDELAECLPGGEARPTARRQGPAQRALRLSARASGRQRQVFLARYFLPLPLGSIAARFSMRENTVKTTLHRTRRRLRDYLEQGGTLMRPEDLYDAFHEIDDDLLETAARPRRLSIRRSAGNALAACALLAAGGLLAAPVEKDCAAVILPFTLASEPTANESATAGSPAMPEPAGLIYSTELLPPLPTSAIRRVILSAHAVERSWPPSGGRRRSG